MKRWIALAAFWLVAVGLASKVAAAEPALVHTVRAGETLASIAELYYGDPRRESVLVSENGLTSEGGSAIVVGLRLVIPTVSYHRAVEGETWAELATRFYGDSHRAFVLIEANHSKSADRPDPGAELLIPYPLRYVVGQNDSLRKVAKTYYDSLTEMNTIRNFNPAWHAKMTRGQIVLVPLHDLVFSEQGRRLAEAQLGAQQLGGDLRKKQSDIDAQLPQLREAQRTGHYADVVAMANRLVGGGDLTGSQVVTVHRELASALVALGRDDLARDAFAVVLAQQPDAELDSVRTSPKVLKVFEDARKARPPAAPAKTPEKKPRAKPADAAKTSERPRSR